MTTHPAGFEHVDPSFDGVVPQHAANDRLSTPVQEPGFHLNPVGMGGRQPMPKATNQLLLLIEKPTFPRLLRVTVPLWVILLGAHCDRTRAIKNKKRAAVSLAAPSVFNTRRSTELANNNDAMPSAQC